MAKNWTEDAALVGAITHNLFEALPLLPKRLVRVDAITRKYNMPFSHVQILCMLSSGGMTIGQISRNLGIAKPNITPLLDSLKERDLLAWKWHGRFVRAFLSRSSRIGRSLSVPATPSASTTPWRR